MVYISLQQMSGIKVLAFRLLDSVPEYSSMELAPRGTKYPLFILGVIILSVLSLSIARLRQKEAYYIVFQHIFLFASSESQQKNGFRINPVSSIFLSLQFVFVSLACIFWGLQMQLNSTHWVLTLALVFVPTLYAIYQLIIIWIAARIAGKTSVIEQFIYTTISSYQMAGIVLFAEFFFFYFQPGLVVNAKWILLGTFLLFVLQRFIRCFFIGISEKITWYHIILYFWTLEIVPLLVLYKLFIIDQKNLF